MPQIPVDQKFHTLNANTPTKERGSAQADGLREIYTMQDIIDSVTTGGGINFTELGDTPSTYVGAAGQVALVNDTEDGLIFGAAGGASSIEVYPISNGGPFSRLVQLDGVDAATGLPRAITPNISTSIVGDLICGVLSPDAVRFEPSEAFVSGKIEGLTFITPTGGGAVVGDIVYAGYGFLLTWGGGRSFDENIPIGRIITTPTLVNTYSDYDLYEATLFLTLPENTAYYIDTVSLNDSIRNHYTTDSSVTLTDFNIVKSESDIQISRWDPSAGDTPEQILGVTTQGFTPASSVDTISACLEGIMRIPETSIGGAQPTVGVPIYSDATTPYLLTTDATSGVKIGRVVKRISRNDSSGTPIAYSFLQVGGGNIGGGGGSTTGEDLSLNVRSNPYSAAGDHEGTVLSIGTLGLTVGTVYYWNGTEWADANAGAVATADGLMGVATATDVAPDVLVSGIIQLASVPGAVGDPLYLDTTNGLLTATAPTGSTQIVRVMGYKLDTNRVYFNPSQDWLEII